MKKIIHYDDLSLLSRDREINGATEVTMSENEIFVFQIAALSECDDCIRSIESLGGAEISCINTDVVDKWGKSRTQSVALKAGIIQPLYFTARVKKAGKCTENGRITIITDSGSTGFDISFNVLTTPVTNNGFDDLWRLSRISWLNSTLNQDDSLVKPYTPPEIKNGRLAVIGRELELTDSGLPGQIYSKYDEAIQVKSDVQKQLFYAPAEFKIGSLSMTGGKTESKVYNNRIESITECKGDGFSAKVSSVLRYEGLAEYSVCITPQRNFTAEDVSLRFYINKDCSSLMHGLGHRASQACDLKFKWDVDKQQDCIFIGSVNCGMRVKFKAENYRRPLINIFYKNLPLKMPVETWDNNGKGEISIAASGECTELTARTGRFEFKKGEQRNFVFEIHMTPLKPIDYKKTFSVRYLHNNSLKNEIKDIDAAVKNNLSHVIFHQGNCIMPYINYPFYEVDRLRNAVCYAHKRSVGIKVYYTEREHSNHMAETFVYKSLGG